MRRIALAAGIVAALAGCWYEVRLPLGAVACEADSDCGEDGLICRLGRCGCSDPAKGGFDCTTTCPAGRTGLDCNACLDPRFGGDYCSTCIAPHFEADCETCERGYRRDGAACVDIDECATDNGGCLHGATCSNTAGGRTCGCTGDWSGAVCGCPKGMIGLEGGSFVRGDGADEQSVVLSPFCIDPTEVRASAFAGAGEGATPATGMNWAQAKDFCAGVGKRLPTEAEWEFAARGADGRLFPWGDDAPTCERAAFGACGVDSPATVGSFASGASPEGVQDLAGNVWEWVADCFAPYGADGERNPRADAADCTHRSVRGGGYSSPGASLRSGDRSKLAETNGREDLGFRCAMDVVP